MPIHVQGKAGAHRGNLCWLWRLPLHGTQEWFVPGGSPCLPFPRLAFALRSCKRKVQRGGVEITATAATITWRAWGGQSRGFPPTPATIFHSRKQPQHVTTNQLRGLPSKQPLWVLKGERPCADPCEGWPHRHQSGQLLSQRRGCPKRQLLVVLATLACGP